MSTRDIVADTSKYPLVGRSLTTARILAAAAVIAAQDAGKVIESAGIGKDNWASFGGPWDVNCLTTLDYRVKPEPVVTKRIEWRLTVPGVEWQEIRHDDGTYGAFKSREEALRVAAWCAGSVRLEQVEVTTTDGVVTKEHSLNGYIFK